MIIRWPQSTLTRRAWMQVTCGMLLSTNALANPRLARRLNEHVSIFDSVNEEPSPANRGRVVPTALIQDGKRAWIVDPGPSYLAAAEVRTVAETVLGLRIAGVINTHAHPEHVLGNAAFGDVPVFATPTTRRLMQARCLRCLSALRRTLGSSAMRGTRIVLPTASLPPRGTLQLGQLELRIQEHLAAHSASDLTLYEPRTQTLLCGGLAYGHRVPDLQEASVPGWLKAIDALAAWPAQAVIGMTGGDVTQTLAPTAEYLRDLAQTVSAEIRSGGDLGALLSGHASKWSDWPGFQSRHALNVQRAWRELEALWWQELPPGG